MLDLTDLINIAETCTRFKALADLVFKSVHLNCGNFNELLEFELTKNEKRRLMINFGYLIRIIHLSAHLDEFCQEYFDQICTYCGENMETFIFEMK